MAFQAARILDYQLVPLRQGENLLDVPMTAQLATASGDQQFLLPMGLGSPVNWAGLLTQRHMAQYGTTEEQFGHHVIAQREYAAQNEDAFFRDRLTMEEYLASRYVSKPVRLLDCDYPCDSGSAVVFTTEDTVVALDVGYGQLAWSLVIHRQETQCPLACPSG